MTVMGIAVAFASVPRLAVPLGSLSSEPPAGPVASPSKLGPVELQAPR